MAVQEFALDATSISRVQVSREIGPDGEQIHVLLDRSMLGTLSGEEAQLTGRVFPLPDGSTLKVQLVYSQVQVLRNGQALLPTSINPAATQKLDLPPKTMGRFRAACGGVFFIGGVNVLLGIVFAFSQSQALAQQVPPVGLIIVGGIFLLLGFFVARKSSVALGIAIAIYSLDGLLSLLQGNFTSIVFHIVLIVWMARGFAAIRALRDAEALAQS